MNNLEFYTIMTSVDILANPRAVEYLLCTVASRAHPVFVGEPRAETGNRYALKFAIDRPMAWECSPSLKETILMNSVDFGFSEENIEVHKADHI